MGGRRRKRKIVWRPRPKTRRTIVLRPPNMHFRCPTCRRTYSLRVHQDDMYCVRFHCLYCRAECRRVAQEGVIMTD